MRFAKSTLLAGVIAGVMLVGQADAEQWSDSTGKFQIEAKFVGVADGKVTLEKSDGSTISVPFARLSAESQSLAKKMYAQMKAGGASGGGRIAPVAANGGGASKLPANPTAQQTIDVVTVAMVESDLDTLWDLMPKSYQSDVDKLLQTAAQNIDANLWNSVGGIVQNVGKLLTTKKEFILNNSKVKGMMPEATPEMLAGWDAGAKVLQAFGNSALTNNAKMKNFTMANFLATDGVKIAAAMKEASELAEQAQGGPVQMSTQPPEFKLISEDTQSATVEITQNEQTQTVNFVKVEGRWVPDEMARDWDKNMNQAMTQLKQMGTPQGRQGMMQATMMLGIVSGPLNGMLNANTQSEFDRVFDPLMDMVGAQIGGLMGGAGGPPGGGFGGPPAFPQ